MIERRTLVILVGVVLVVIGCFLPLIRIKETDRFNPFEGLDKSTYWDIDDENDIPADGPAIYVLALAAVAVLMVLMRQSDSTWLPGLLMDLILALEFNGFWAWSNNNDYFSLGSAWIALILGAILITGAPVIPPDTIFYPDVAPDPYLLDEQP